MRFGVRPTWFGATLLAFVVAGRLLAPAAADPKVAGAVWAALVVVLAVGAVWPVLVVASARVRVAASPTDSTAGDVAELTTRVSGWPGSVEVRLADGSLPRDAGWQRVEAPGRVSISATAPRRGVYDAVELEVRSSAPLGVVRARAVRRCRLPATWWVAPAPTTEHWLPTTTAERLADGASRSAARVGDVVRSVRPYVVGDPAHLVHWPSTARSGDLMVRELEPPADVGLAIVVELGSDPTAADGVASQAAGFVWAVHVAGGRVVVCTHDSAAGPRRVEVATTIEAGRLLAGATPGTPATPPDRWPILVVRP